MSYEPTIWNNGDIITKEKMNKIQQGIADSKIVFIHFTGIDEHENPILDMTYNDIIECLQNEKLPIIIDLRDGDTSKHFYIYSYMYGHGLTFNSGGDSITVYPAIPAR